MSKREFPDFDNSPKPWLRMKLLCEKSCPDFFVCEVYQNKEDMLKAMSVLDGRRAAPCKACCFTYRAYESNRRTAEQGTLFFYKQYIPVHVLAHEFFHAGLSWARRRRFKFRDASREEACPGEERTATMVENLMFQFFTKQKKRVYFIAGSDITYKDLLKAAA